MKYIFLFVTVTMITEIVSFFPNSIATIAKDTNSLNTPISVFMATKTGRMVSYINWLLPIKLLIALVMFVLQDHMANQNYYISMTHNDKFQLIKLYDPSIMWFGEVT